MADKPATYDAAAIGEVFQSVVDEVREVYQHELEAAPTLSGDDFRNLLGLATKLKNSPDSISAYVRGKLQSRTRSTLEKWTTTVVSDDLEAALLGDLNAIIKGESIYRADVFKDIALRPQTRELLAQEPQRSVLARLNRSLLQDAFPNELWQAAQLPSALLNAVDLELNFKTITINETGWVLFGKDTDQSQMEIRLATRITPPATPLKPV